MLNLKSYVPSFRMPRNIISGEGSLAALSGLTGARVAILAGESLLSKPELRQRLEASLRTPEVHFISKSWSLEPDLASLAGSIAEIENINPDIIIAIGGGSVIDGARLVWMYFEHPDVPSELLSRPFSIPRLRGKCRFVAIPTTVGTGSEVSSAAVLTDPESHRKIPVVSHDFIPDLVVLDPMLVKGLPKSLIASTSIDALSHLIEGYVSTLRNPVADAIAEKSLQMIVECGPRAIEQSDLAAMEQLQIAACFAGAVQNHCLTGAAHAIAHQLGEFGIGHGLANAIVLPSVIRFNARDPAVRQKYERLSGISGIGKTTEDLASFIERYAEAGGLNCLLRSQVHTGKPDSRRLAEAALMDPNARSNPVPLNADILENLVDACW